MTRDRCEAHRLAVGPDGQCVLCRRDADGGHSPAALPVPARSGGFGWLLGATGAACLAMSFLGGVALAKGANGANGHARPEVEQVAATPALGGEHIGAACEPTPQLAPVEEPKVEAREVNPAPPPVVAPTPERQRNYLDEAYAAIDKRGLYDTAQVSSRGDATPAAKAGCVPRYYLARGPGNYGYGANAANVPGSGYGNPSRVAVGTPGMTGMTGMTNGGGRAGGGGGGHFGAR